MQGNNGLLEFDPLNNKQSNLQLRMISKKFLTNDELAKRIFINVLCYESDPGRSRGENLVCNILQKDIKSEEDYQELNEYFNRTTFYTAVRTEYDPRIYQELLKLLDIVEFNSNQDIISYGNFLADH